MKQLFFFFVLIPLLVNCKNQNNETKTNSANTITTTASFVTIDLKIEGMTCAIGCAKTIENKLNSLEGIKNAIVNFDTKTATVTFDQKKLTKEAIIKTIESTADGKTYTVVN